MDEQGLQRIGVHLKEWQRETRASLDTIKAGLEEAKRRTQVTQQHLSKLLEDLGNPS